MPLQNRNPENPFILIIRVSEPVAGNIGKCFFDNVIHPVSKFFNGIFRAARLAA